MSGRKQHFIPQAVQRGFAAVRGKKAAQVYVFRKGRAPYLSATEGVAAERDFYSTPSAAETLDDAITRYESSILGPALASLRDSELGRIDSQAAAAVVVHLSIRSAFIRGTFSNAATELLSQFSKVLTSHDNTRVLLGVDSLASESMMVKGIEEELEKLLPPHMPDNERAFFGKLMHLRAREKFEQMHPGLAATALEQFEMLLDRMPEIMVDAHSKALDKDLVPARRVERLKAMNWQIIAAPSGGHFVLPDSLALGAKTADFRTLEPYALLGDEELNGVVMPISAARLLVGCSGEPQLELANLNQVFARCCLEFFISSRDDDVTRAAAQIIGTSVTEFVVDMVSDQAFAAPQEVADGTSAIASRPQAKVVVKFEPTARKSGKAESAVRNLLRVPQLQEGMRLVDYVVVTDNVAQSLRRRGLQLTEVAAQSVTSGTCHVIDSQGGLNCQLFVPRQLVDAVVRGTEKARGAAALIRHQAGRATYFASLAARVPSDILRRTRPLLGRETLRIASVFASHYFGARMSTDCRLSDSELSATIGVYGQVAAASARELERARVHFMEHRDANAAIGHALTHAELLLTATATSCAAFVGHIDRLTQGGDGGAAVLRAATLDEWVLLFARDLERYFESRENWEGDEQLRLLAGHVERLLWSFGIVLTENGPESIIIHTLTDDRLSEFRKILSA